MSEESLQDDCGLPPAVVGVSRWTKRHLKWHLAEPIVMNGVGYAKAVEVIASAWWEWGMFCGVTAEFVASPELSDVLISTGPIDGRWGLLALTEAPDGDTNCHRRIVLDEDELWTTEMLPLYDGIVLAVVVRHEIGHVLGIQHTSRGVMYDEYTPQTVPFSDEDIHEARLRYGRGRL